MPEQLGLLNRDSLIKFIAYRQKDVPNIPANSVRSQYTRHSCLHFLQGGHRYIATGKEHSVFLGIYIIACYIMGITHLCVITFNSRNTKLSVVGRPWKEVLKG